MVRNVLSLRALFKNASCMFCACFSKGLSFLDRPGGQTAIRPVRAGSLIASSSYPVWVLLNLHQLRPGRREQPFRESAAADQALNQGQGSADPLAVDQ